VKTIGIDGAEYRLIRALATYLDVVGPRSNAESGYEHGVHFHLDDGGAFGTIGIEDEQTGRLGR
jgi:hypothetical protein